MEAEAGTAQAQQKTAWQGKLGKAVVVALAIYGGFHLFAAKVEKDAAEASAAAGSPVPAAAPVLPAAPPVPTHFYSLHEDGAYGYESALSEDDQKRGTMTKPLMMVRYLGKRNGAHVVEMRDGASRSISSCEEPCEFAKQTTYFDGVQVGEERVRNVPGSIMNAIMQDAMSGQLEPYVPAKPAEAGVGT